ncbi:MAG: hypothetical protein EAY75_13150 [Bacteroidetes bacterium]|nr:MAG: hypothetical protein EAY75_13150 [Bacteroidota bacterium]
MAKDRLLKCCRRSATTTQNEKVSRSIILQYLRFIVLLDQPQIILTHRGYYFYDTELKHCKH